MLQPILSSSTRATARSIIHRVHTPAHEPELEDARQLGVRQASVLRYISKQLAASAHESVGNTHKSHWGPSTANVTGDHLAVTDSWEDRSNSMGGIVAGGVSLALEASSSTPKVRGESPSISLARLVQPPLVPTSGLADPLKK
jgi:hypothetical protein